MTDDIVSRLDSAPLSAPVYRTARRLLDRSSNGVVRLTHAEMRQVAGADSDGTARNHLHALHAAGLITYRRNAAVTIWWNPADDDADQPARTACTVHAQCANCTPSARSEEEPCTPSVQIARPACTVHAQRAPSEEADYIDRRSLSSIEDNDDNNASSLSSSSAAVSEPVSVTANSDQNQPPDGTAQPTYEQISALYEQNIGMLTPLMAGTLKTAMRTWPPWWIEHAIRLAVTNEVRRWSYVEGILANWQREGFNVQGKRKTNHAGGSAGSSGRTAAADRRPAWANTPREQPEFDPDFIAALNGDDPAGIYPDGA